MDALGSTVSNSPTVDVQQLVNVIQTGNRIGMATTQSLIDRLIPPANKSRLCIPGSSVGTLVTTGSGMLVGISVVVPSSAPGYIYDSASVANSTNTNIIGVIPISTAVGSIFTTVNFPFFNGLVVQPSSVNSQSVSVSYFSTS